MHLKIQRSQRSSGLLGKSVLFCLDARVELTPAEAANVKKYGLGKQVIYNSNQAMKHIDAGRTALAAGGAGGFVRSMAHLAMAKLALNITIDSLTAGQHIECKDLDELMGAEEAVRNACVGLKNYLEVAATFDGREIVIDLNQQAPAV